jgi:ATP synthase protein I
MFGLTGVSKKTTEFLEGHYDPWQEDSEEDFVTLDAAQAQALREQQPGLSASQVVALQALCGFVFAAIAGLVSTRGWSVAYGAFTVVLPNALLARGMTRKPTSINVLSAVVALLVWEMVKVALTLAMLFGAPWVVKNLSWPALLVGLVLTMKVHWLALAFNPKRPATNQV